MGRGAGRGKLGRKGEEPKEKDGSCNIHAVRCLLEKSRLTNEIDATYNSDTGPLLAAEVRCGVRREGGYGSCLCNEYMKPNWVEDAALIIYPDQYVGAQ